MDPSEVSGSGQGYQDAKQPENGPTGAPGTSLPMNSPFGFTPLAGNPSGFDFDSDSSCNKARYRSSLPVPSVAVDLHTVHIPSFCVPQSSPRASISTSFAADSTLKPHASESMEPIASFSTFLERSGTDCMQSEQKPGGLRDAWLLTRTFMSRMLQIARTAPLTFCIPLIVFTILVVSGEEAVWREAKRESQQTRSRISNQADTAASQLDFMILSWMAPTIAAGAIVQEQPYVPTLLNNISEWAAPIMDYLHSPNSSIPFSLKIVPWGRFAGDYPTEPNSSDMLNQNFFDLPGYRLTLAAFTSSPPGQVDLIGPIDIFSGGEAFCLGNNVWIPSTDPNSTWGMDQPIIVPWASVVLGNATAPMYGGCGSACAPRKQPDGTYWVYWGIFCNMVSDTELIDMLMPLTERLRDRLRVGLYRVFTQEFIEVYGKAISEDTLTHEVENTQIFVSDAGEPCATPSDCECRLVGTKTTLRLNWQICISPVNGYTPSWLVPVQISVVMFALVVAVLTLMLRVSLEKHRVLVQAMLPKKVIKHLALGKTYAEAFRNVTILFTDIVSYTNLSAELPPEDLVEVLNELYHGFDDLADKHNLYKVETIGDAFMCVGGAPDPCQPADAARRVAHMALDMVAFAEGFETSCKRRIQIRVGMHTGDVCAAVIGRKMPHWCLVGDTVNVSSRMESNSRAMQVHVSASTAALLAKFPDEFALEPRGTVNIKGKGPMTTFWLRSKELQQDAPTPLTPSLSPYPLPLPVPPTSPPTSACCE